MQHRSRAYQAVLYYVREADPVRGVQFDTLAWDVADHVNEDRARAYRLSRLKKAPSETDAETISEGQVGIARKYIDQAHRQGLITYNEDNYPYGRTVHWSRPARTGGTHGQPDGEREAREHADFHRYLLSSGVGRLGV